MFCIITFSRNHRFPFRFFCQCIIVPIIYNNRKRSNLYHFLYIYLFFYAFYFSRICYILYPWLQRSYVFFSIQSHSDSLIFASFRRWAYCSYDPFFAKYLRIRPHLICEVMEFVSSMCQPIIIANDWFVRIIDKRTDFGPRMRRIQTKLP